MRISVLIAFFSFFAISLAEPSHGFDFKKLLESLEHKLNEKWTRQLEMRDAKILKLESRLKTLEDHCYENGIEGLDLNEDVEELKLKVGKLEDEDKQLSFKIDENRLDLAVVHDDLFNLDTKTNELQANHSKDHQLTLAYVHENSDAINTNVDSIHANENQILSNKNDIQENQNLIDANMKSIQMNHGLIQENKNSIGANYNDLDQRMQKLEFKSHLNSFNGNYRPSY